MREEVYREGNQRGGRDRPIVKVGIYVRKSRTEEGIQDLKKHSDYLVQLAEENEWKYELYEEVDSSQKLDRKELQRLRRDISLGKIDAVILYNIDRLTRKARHFLEIVEDYFLDFGMNRLFVKNQEYDLTDATTITMLQIQATLSQAEYSFIVARLNEGKKRSAEKGYQIGKTVYGYKRNPETKKLEIAPEEAKVVRLMIDKTLEGKAYGTICTELNEAGYRTRKGNVWEVYNIKSILFSPAVRGHMITHWRDGSSTCVYDAHEALMNDSEFQQIQEILSARKWSYKNLKAKPKHFLQGLMKCPYCGHVMCIHGEKHSGRYYVRACRPYKFSEGEAKCENKGVQAEIAEEIVKKALKTQEDNIVNEIEKLKKVNVQEIQTGTRESINSYKKQLQKMESQEDNLLDFLNDGTIDRETYKKRINKLKDDKAQIKESLNLAEERLRSFSVEVKMEHEENVLGLIRRWDSLSFEEKRRTLQMTFSKIEYRRVDKNKPPKLTFYPL